MSYVNRITLDALLQSANAQILKSETVHMILRSILESVVEENTNSVVLMRIINTDGIESLLRRLEYCQNVSLHSFMRVDANSEKNLGHAEFIVVTSQRFSAALVWSSQWTHEKDLLSVYFLMNSNNIDDVYEIINKNGNEIIRKEYYSYKPERRSNRVLNMVINKITKSLNDIVEENRIKEEEKREILSQDVLKSFREESYKNIRECCHEMKNQFSIIDVYSEVLKKQFGDNKNINMILKSIGSVNKLLGELRESQSYNIEKMPFRETVSDICDMMEGALKKSNNEIVLTGGDIKDEIFIDAEKFRAVLINVLKNANDFTHDDKIEVKLSAADKSAEVLIINHGEPIREEDKESIFNSGFTTKKEGWGIGLDLCRKYLEGQAGSIELVKSDRESTEFLIKIQKAS